MNPRQIQHFGDPRAGMRLTRGAAAPGWNALLGEISGLQAIS
jgi:hypothetical protein